MKTFIIVTRHYQLVEAQGSLLDVYGGGELIVGDAKEPSRPCAVFAPGFWIMATESAEGVSQRLRDALVTRKETP